MSDYSKCFGENCPKKETCLRYLLPSSRFQSYISEKACMQNNFDLFLGDKKQKEENKYDKGAMDNILC